MRVLKTADLGTQALLVVNSFKLHLTALKAHIFSYSHHSLHNSHFLSSSVQAERLNKWVSKQVSEGAHLCEHKIGKKGVGRISFLIPFPSSQFFAHPRHAHPNTRSLVQSLSEWKMTGNGCYTAYLYHFSWNKHLRNSIHYMPVWVHHVPALLRALYIAQAKLMSQVWVHGFWRTLMSMFITQQWIWGCFLFCH